MGKYFKDRSKKYWIFLVIIALLNFGFLLSNQSIGVDDENFKFYFDNYGIAMSGRYGYVLLMKIFNTYEYFPVWRDGIAICLLIVGITIMLGVFQKLSSDSISENGEIIFSAIVVTYPLLSKMLVYISINLEVSLMLVLAGMALHYSFLFLEKKKYKYVIYSITLLTFGISMIENCLNYYVTGCLLGFIIILWKKNKKYMKQWAHQGKQFIEVVVKIMFFAGVSIASIVLNRTISRIICSILGLGLNQYTSKFIAWDFSNIKAYLSTFIYSLKVIFIHYFHNTFYFKVLLFSIVLIVLLITIEAVRKQNISLFCCGIASVCSVFLFYIITGNAKMVTRTFVVYSIFCGFVIMFVYEWIKTKKMKSFFLILVTFIVFYQSREVQVFYQADYNRYLKDSNLAHEINQEIVKQCDGVPSVPVIFIGSPLKYIDFPNTEDDVNMRSMFSDNKDGTSVRIHQFFNMLGYHYISPIEDITPDNVYNMGNHSLTLKGKRIAETMPIWPQKGSVLEKEGLVVVKLGPIQNQYFNMSQLEFENELFISDKKINKDVKGNIEISKCVNESAKTKIYIKGLAYFTDRSSQGSRISIILDKEDEHYILDTEQMPTMKSDTYSKYDTLEKNMNEFVIYREIPEISSGTWKVSIMLTNGEKISILDDDKMKEIMIP